MKKFISSKSILFFLLLSMTCQSVNALRLDGEIESSKPLENDENELGGLILDRTITMMGKSFYRYFVGYWRNEYPHDNSSFTIYERPSARWGSQIWIKYKDKEFYKQFMSPRDLNNKERPEAIAKAMHEEIKEQLILELTIDRFDVEKSEI